MTEEFGAYKETCSIHGCDMEGEHCPECEKEAQEFVDKVLEDVRKDLVQTGQTRNE